MHMRSLSLALGSLLASFASAQAPSAPESFAIYYAWPSGVNFSQNDTTKAAAVFAAYPRVVLGEDLEQSAHGDHLRAIEIIKKAPNTDFFGYVPLGQLSGNKRLTLAEIKARIAAWDSMGVAGIFLDEAGYDYGVTRNLQNAAVKEAHDRKLAAWVNPWVPADVFDPAKVPLNKDGGGNPDGLASLLGPKDFCLLESFQITNGQYRLAKDFTAKADAAVAYRAQFKTRLQAITTTTKTIGFSRAKFDYAYFSALLYGLDGFTWGEPEFGTIHEQLPTIARPVTPGLGTRWLPGGVIHAASLDLHHRMTDTGNVRLDTQRHVGGFFEARASVPTQVTMGVEVRLPLTAGGSAGRPYFAGVAVSTTAPITLRDGRVFPLAADGLLFLSWTPNNGVFRNFFGTLDASAQATPSIFVPRIAALSGLPMHFAFGVMDSALPDDLRTVSIAYPTRLQ